MGIQGQVENEGGRGGIDKIKEEIGETKNIN